jgi:hypothetical protein
MFAYNHNAPPHGSVVSLISTAVLMLAAMFAPPAFALDAGDITVGSLKGEVQVTMNGAARRVRVGSVLELPATVRTGRDGAIELRQGTTSVAVGPDTVLEFPALEKPGAPVDRVIQPRGNAFYDIGKREGRKLRVETPYLVGVVKGTQFNVAAQDESATISLFEGLLEVRAADDSAVVELEAGEIASLRRGEKSISVLRMDAGRTPTPGARPATGSGGGGDVAGIAPPAVRSDLHRDVPGDDDGAKPSLLEPADSRPDPTDVSTSVDVRTPVAAVGVEASLDLGVGNPGVNIGANVIVGSAVDIGGTVDVGGAVSVGADASVNLGTGVEVDANTSVNVGNSVSAGVDLSVSLGGDAASVDVATNVGADAGIASIGAITSVSVDVAPTGVSIDSGIGAQIDAGPAAVDLGAAAGVDLGAAGVAVDAGAGAAVDAGPITAAVDTGASIDVGSDSIGATVDAGAAMGGALGSVAPAIDAGLTTAVDVSTGTVDLGVSVGGLDIGVGLDLGLGGNDSATDTDSSTTDTATDTGNTGTVDVGGLLDGLLRRPGRR